MKCFIKINLLRPSLSVLEFSSFEMPTAVKTLTKASLRKRMKDELARLPLNDRKRQSLAAVKKLFKLPIFKNSKRISVFLSTESEIDTEPIVRKIFEDGKECFVPRYTKKTMEMVKLCSMEDWRTLPLTKWKIKQPDISEERENALETGGLDLIVCPGVAFTLNGLRLGHGGGYYDRYLRHLQQDGSLRPTTTVALAFNEQIVQEIPCEPHDVAVDLVLTAD